MNPVNAVFTAEKRDFSEAVCPELYGFLASPNLGNKTFTIGVSTIGGNDIIGLNPGSIGSPGNYKYFDELLCDVIGLERGYATGGLTMALAEAILDNTSRRFTPRQRAECQSLIPLSFHLRQSLSMQALTSVDDITVPQVQYDCRSAFYRYVNSADNAEYGHYMQFFNDKTIDQTAAAVVTGQMHRPAYSNPAD